MGDHGSQRPGAKRIVLWPCALSAVILLAHPHVAAAQISPIVKRAKLHVLDMVVDQQLMAKMRDGLIMSEAQAAEMQRSFDAYWKEILDIDARGYERALDAGIREAMSVVETFNAEKKKVAPNGIPKDPVDYERRKQERNARIDELTVRYHPQILAAIREGDVALESWLTHLRDIGAVDEQQEQSMLQLVRRKNFDFLGSSMSGDFEVVPEVLVLIEEASALGGELEKSRGDDRFEESLVAIVSEYERNVDTCVAITMELAREPIRSSTLTEISPQENPKEYNNWRRRTCDHWMRRYDASRKAVDAIALLLDEDAKQNWERRFLNALGPELMNDARLPDRLVVWLQSRADVTDVQIASARTVASDWIKTRDQLRPRIVAAAIQAKREIPILALGAANDDGEKALARFASLEYRLHESALQAVDRFKDILTREQRADFERDFPKLQIKTMDARLGPPMESAVMRAVNPPVTTFTQP